VLQIQQKVNFLEMFFAMLELKLSFKLETALASERVQEWKNRSAAAHSSTEDERSNESDAVPVRARLAKGTKLVNNPPGKARKRTRSNTASSTQTSTITRRSVDTISSSATPRRAASPRADQRTPQAEPQVESSADEGTVADSNQPLRKIASGASLSALSPSEPATPSTPALTPAIGFITDDSDTEFQSAYSTSPRDSYVSFDGRQTPLYHDSDDSVEFTDQSRDYGKQVASQLTKAPVRERVSSTATAIFQTRTVS
jgi:hypothetical protein